ncbi:vacuolar protein sorting-associated protein 9A-like [Daucus carota subsp. sativus]|uniref:vacuolar protein sorting-associated protein 9A-like n=1 Tax=Daucus carota subsp. sativus TaxID=79200 RepID=UPI0030828579
METCSACQLGKQTRTPHNAKKMGLEKYVMTKLFTGVYASVPEEVNEDDLLHEKVSLIQQFIRPENLDIQPIYQNETSWLLAQNELQNINMYKAPRDKLAASLTVARLSITCCSMYPLLQMRILLVLMNFFLLLSMLP